MSGDGRQIKLRGRPVVLPPWWLERANLCWRQCKQQRWSMQRLADELTDAVGRELAGERFTWDRKTVERFLDNENTTQELTEAFCALFPSVLVQPTFVADTLEEAQAIRAVVEAFRASANPDKARRREQLAEARADLEKRAHDQIAALDSKEHADAEARERGASGRRARGVGRGRPTTS